MEGPALPWAGGGGPLRDRKGHTLDTNHIEWRHYLPAAVRGLGSNPCVRAESLQSCVTLCDPMGCSSQAPLSMDFSRQAYLYGLPFPSLGYLPNPGIEPGVSHIAGRFFTI